MSNPAYQACVDLIRANYIPLHTHSMSPETVLENYTIDPSAFILLNAVLAKLADEIEGMSDE